MRKKRRLAAFVIISLVIGLLGSLRQNSAIAVENDSITSVDGFYKYRELNDGTISLVACSGGLHELEDGGKQLIIPDEVDGKAVSGVEAEAFADYDKEPVSEVILPKNLKTVDITGLRDLYYVKSIHIDSANEYFCTEDGVLFDKSKGTLLRVPPAMEVADSSKDYVIPDTVTVIGDDAFFNCYGVNHITISKNVEVIGNCAFYRYLASNYTFTFTVDPDNRNFRLDEQGNLFSKDMTVLYRYVYPEDEEAVFNLPVFAVPDTVKTIASAAFQGSTGSGWLDGLVSVNIPDSVTEIGERAFEGCSYLGDWMAAPIVDASTEVVIPDSVVSIGKRAFYGCAMESLILSKNLTEIEKECFAECQALSKVTFGEKVSKVSEFAFYDCTKLKEITIPSHVLEILDYAFGYCATENGVAGITGFMINCEEGSAAAAYAKANGFNFTTGGGDTIPTPAPTAVPTAVPTVKPTVTPTVTPTPKPSIAKPAAVSGLTLKNKKGKKMVVSWKKVRDAAGYQIQYSTSKKMKAAKKVTVKKASKTKMTITKLKKKKRYYVRIRSYKKVGAKKMYSSWSKIKKVKITK